MVRMTEGEKKLLNTLGKYPDISLKELLNHTNFKWESTVKRKLDHLAKQYFIRGPFYEIDYSKLCKNPIHLFMSILELNKDYQTVISYLRLIEPLKVVYPVLSPHKEILGALFLSSHDKEMVNILQVLKDAAIITDYIPHVYTSKRMKENPNFFGESNPLLDNLLTPCDVPDMSLQGYDTVWNECDISILPYLESGYKNGKLIEILRKEKECNRTWTYEQVKYSRTKMIKNGLIEKDYMIFPYPYEQCADFIIFFKSETKDPEIIQIILYNFGRGGRLYRDYVICEDWGSIGFVCNPLFLTTLMNKLDKIDEIAEKKVYQIRSVPPKNFILVQPTDLTWFDVEKQTLVYPYHVYTEKIKEKLENES
jgi:hypothetical protein